jgi:hypothetical protein
MAAMIVSTQLGSSFGSAAPIAGQIADMQRHLASRDYEALAGYLLTSPDLMSENSPLSQALFSFMEAYQSGTVRAFSDEDLAVLETRMAEACRSTEGTGARRDCSIY